MTKDSRCATCIAAQKTYNNYHFKEGFRAAEPWFITIIKVGSKYGSFALAQNLALTKGTQLSE